jgi:hypothetical protein|tara:strand:- start:4330 stop:4779 length:450 start_codon:yes stop_codon:yes gene_type:complete
MLSLLGTLIGFAGSAVPSILGHFKEKQVSKDNLAILEMQGKLARDGVELNLMEFREKAADDEHKRLIEHDIAISKDTSFMGQIRASVRPLITYLFFGLFAAVKISALIVAMDNSANFDVAINQVWDDETQAIFAAIISFWFGSRALAKK